MNTTPFYLNWISLEEYNPRHYNVYVVELSKDVLNEHKFKKRNINAKPNSKCLYVGMTGLDPIVRFQKHKDGIKSNVYVQRYGIKLLPELYKKFNPMTFEEAKERETNLAIELQHHGYSVWQA